MAKISVLKKLDKYIALPLLYLLPRKSHKSSLKIKNILMIKTVAIGDLVLLLPTIKALKEQFKEAKITLLTTPRVKEVVEGQPFIDEIIYYDILGSDKGVKGFKRVVNRIKKGNFHLAVDFEHYYNFTALMCRLAGVSKMAGFEIENQKRKKFFDIKIPYKEHFHEVEAFYETAKVFGAKNKKIVLKKITTSQEDKEHVKSFLKDKKITPNDIVIGIHPGTSSSAKVRRWQPKKFAKVINVLVKNYGAKVVITGTQQDKEIIEEITKSVILNRTKRNEESSKGSSALPQNDNPLSCALRSTPYLTISTNFSLKQFAEFSRRCNLFISVDTGPMHIASAMGTKTIGLFGPNTPQKWGPYGFLDLAIYKKLNCSPCTKQYLGQISKCKTGECMKEITSKDVLAMTEQALATEFATLG